MVVLWISLTLLWATTNAAKIKLLECEPPDMPLWGGYGPIQRFYTPGDVIHYYCDLETHIAGNYYRRCEDTGGWTGETPVCDAPSTFSSTTQSSTANEGISELATDGDRTTCTATRGGDKEEWFGNFTKPGELMRVMIFLPKGPVSYEVAMVRANGSEFICGSQTNDIDRYDWTFHNCPGPNNIGAIGLKIRSLTTAPLQICEIQAHVLISPKCLDPQLQIANGRVRLTRYTATLVCNAGYKPNRENRLECIRERVWNRKPLYCIKPEWEMNNEEPVPGGNCGSDNEPKRENPDRERLERPKRLKTGQNISHTDAKI